MSKLSPENVEKRIKMWADVTMLSLELKRTLLRKRHPELGEDEVKKMMHKDSG